MQRARARPREGELGDRDKETSSICHRIEERLVYEITCLVTVWISSLILKTPIYVRATIKQNQKIMHTHSEWAQKSNFTLNHTHTHTNNRTRKKTHLPSTTIICCSSERVLGIKYKPCKITARMNEWMIKSLSRLLISNICWASVFDYHSFELCKYIVKGQNWISIKNVNKIC